jgi:hypothetical protein
MLGSAAGWYLRSFSPHMFVIAERVLFESCEANAVRRWTFQDAPCHLGRLFRRSTFACSGKLFFPPSEGPGLTRKKLLTVLVSLLWFFFL